MPQGPGDKAAPRGKDRAQKGGEAGVGDIWGGVVATGVTNLLRLGPETAQAYWS